MCCLRQQHLRTASFSLLFAPKPINGAARLGRSVVACQLVTKLHTVTRLLAVRIPVHREQKELDIVALSRCSGASNVSPREGERAASASPNVCVCSSRNPPKKATWHHINAAFVSFSMSRMQFYVTDSLWKGDCSDRRRDLFPTLKLSLSCWSSPGRE